MASILKLGPRLENVIDLCENAKVSADIGCDHGYIACELILQNKSSKVIAIDVSRQSLNKAILFAESINISEYISFRDGFGASNITKYDKVKQAVIAGMGGMEIIEILEKSRFIFPRLVLQPMSGDIAIRKWLLSNGYRIEKDYYVKEDGKFYTVIKARLKEPKPINELELYFGKDNFDVARGTFFDYLYQEKDKYDHLAQRLGELNDRYTEEYHYVAKALELMEDKKEEFDKLPKRKKYRKNATKVFK